MPTSGTTTFSLTAQQVITRALRRINVLGEGEAPTADQAEDARIELNLMLKTWQLDGVSLWRTTTQSVTPVNGTASYTLSPRFRTLQDVLWRDSDTDRRLTQMTRAEYEDLSAKTATGAPVKFYHDRQRSTSVITLWPVPTGVTTQTLRVVGERIIEDVAAVGDDLDAPQEYLDAVIYALAARLSGLYGVENPRVDALAESLYARLAGDDREPSVYFFPRGS